MDIWKLIKLFLSGKIIGGRGDGSLDLIYSFCIKSRHKFGLRKKFENIWLGTLCDLYFVLNFSLSKSRSELKIEKTNTAKNDSSVVTYLTHNSMIAET